MPTEQDVELFFRGDTPIMDLAVTQEDGVTPYDLTNHTIWMTAKRNKDDADVDAIFQASTISGAITITNGPAGLAQIVPPTTATSSLTADENLFYDVQVRNNAGTRTHTVTYGRLKVRRDVTRA